MVFRKRVCGLILCFALLFSMTVITDAATKVTEEYKTEKLYTAKETYILPMWHYSGQYWKIGSGSSAVTISDAVIEQNNGLSKYLSDAYSSVDFKISLPDSVKEARAAGNEIKVSYESRGSASLSELFEKNSITVITDMSDGKDYFEISLVPKFNLVKDRDFTDYVQGLSHSIPLINYKYGNNVYSLFGNGANAVQCTGVFDAASMSKVTVPYMHPSFILDRSGKLDSGNIISLGGKTVSTQGYSVGQGTFSNAGACGINFVFPINIVFSKVTVTQIDAEIPNEPNSSDGGNHGGDGNRSEPPSEPSLDTEISEDKTNIHAILSLPEEAYEGQTVTAEDNSTFDCNGVYYSSYNAYSKGIASHSFDHYGAQYHSKTRTSVDISYPEAGTYCVSLYVDAASGEESSDAKVIRILPCPAVSASIGGKQLENRKQSLTVTVEQNPKYPIKELTLKISEEKSGETITVTRNFSGKQAEPVNTTHIKYRSLFDVSSDENHITSELDFLSKFSDNRTFTYLVTATDTRGHSASTKGSFTVAKDTPPTAMIGIAKRYYREENSDTAVIQLTDESLGSGNFQRTWTFDGSDYQDLSFGTGKTISFRREGVGEFTVGLTIKDLWTDETLEEYVSDADHLRASATASSAVDNIAPMVSLEMRNAGKEEILLLASDKETKAAIESAIPSLKAELAGRGISADIHVDLRLSQGITKTGSLRLVRQIGTSTSSAPSGTTFYYAHMESSFWSTGHITADQDTIYSMDSRNFTQMGYKGSYLKRTYPFYITAYDSRTGSAKWTFTIDEGLFETADNFENAALGHDEQSKYLYLISDGKTLLIDKGTGTYVSIIPRELGTHNFVQNSIIYSIKSDGIYKYCGESMEEIYSGEIFTGQNRIRTIGAKIRFIEKKNNCACLSTFDPVSCSISSAILSETEDFSECASIDTRGNVLIRMNAYSFKRYDINGKNLGTIALSASVDASVPSYDGSGRVRYVAGSYREIWRIKGQYSYYNYMTVSALDASYSGSNYIRRDDDFRSYTNVASAIECNDGVVAALLPALIVVGDSYPLYSMTEFNFSTTGGDNNCGILVGTGMPPTDSVGWFEGGTLISKFICVYNNIAMAVNVSESEEDEIERLKAKWLTDPNGICIMADKNTNAETIIKALKRDEEDLELPSRIYKMNEPVEYKIYYSDYENDPSAQSYWLYTHEPGGDGLWENSGKILNAPTESFSKNGRYTLVHWQKDNAGRGLSSEYDKESNKCTMVFYITDEGADHSGNAGSPPEITSITTDPQNIYLDDSCNISVSVNDPDGDILNVTVDVFRSGNSEPTVTYSENVSPNGTVYPDIIVPNIPITEPGIYEIIVTANDGSSADIESARFTPLVVNKLNAGVEHTDSWESNRQSFNLKYFGDPGARLISDYDSYSVSESPRKRGINVFWPGEKLVLSAKLTGEVISVTAEIQNYEYSAVLESAGDGNFTGALYDPSMKKVFTTGLPIPVTVRFTATYKDSTRQTFDIPIIFDEDIGYWMLHRTL